MPEHRITVYPSKALEVVNNDLIVEVEADGQKWGELRISKGSIDWVPRNNKRARRLGWERFDAVMRENGRPV
jgi:hypothetical protein